VKGVLTRGRLVSGIGNVYADEILHEAMIYPFKKVPRLSADQLASLHGATQYPLTR
jgi:formamidopyrimidine-DNA glycosylase